MEIQDVAEITSWHAHVYFDAETRDSAFAFREVVSGHFGLRAVIGRFHERPVGPHPMWSFQLAFEPEHFAYIVGWLTLNHGTLPVFIHPNTGDALRDHRDCALWIGQSYPLVLSALL
jgi:aromatic ring-cleaving dioxygenase